MTETKNIASPLTNYKSNEETGKEVLNSDAIQTFAFMGTDIRVIVKDDGSWFVASDVCDALNLQNPTKSLSPLDDDERSNFKLGRQGEANIISEAGLYSLILRSRKPEAKEFKRWVTHEVLPAINRQGVYAASPEAAQNLEMTAARLDQLEAGITRIEATLTGRQPNKVLVENGYAYKDTYGYHPSRWAENCKLAAEIIKRETIFHSTSHFSTTVGITAKGKTRLLHDLQKDCPKIIQQTELTEAAE